MLFPARQLYGRKEITGNFRNALYFLDFLDQYLQINHEIL
jgi:hypothetical protein